MELISDIEEDSERAEKTMENTSENKRLIVVEPVVVLAVISAYPLDIIFSQFLYRSVGLHMGINVDNLTDSNNSSTVCGIDIDATSYILRERVQAETSRWSMYINLAGFLPMILSYVLYGSLSDRFGRKFLFILPPIAVILKAGIIMAGITYEFPPWVYFFNNIERVLGGNEVTFVACHAYIADTCSKDKLTFRLIIIELLVLFPSGLANLAVGYWIDQSGFFWPTAYVAIVELVALLYGIFFIPESLPKSKRKLDSGVLTRAYDLFGKDDGTHRRWKLNLLLFSYAVGNVFKSLVLMRLFQMNAPLCWSSWLMGTYDAVNRVLKGGASFLAGSVFTRYMAEEWLVVIARLSQILGNLYIIAVQSTLMMFVTPIIAAFDIIQVPMMRAILSKLVSSDEQGTLFAMVTVAFKSVSIINEVGANNMYSMTIYILQGRIIFAVQTLAAFASMTALLFYIKKTSTGVSSHWLCCWRKDKERTPLIN